jgi:hypothetical protein
MALGLAPLAVSAALAVDAPGTGAGGTGAGVGGRSGGGVGVGDDGGSEAAAVRAELVQHAARRLTRLAPDASTGSASTGSAGSSAGSSACASLAVAEAVLAALQDVLTDPAVVSLVREAAARRLGV